MTSLLKGAAFFLRGISMLRRPKVRSWAAIPIFLSALIYVGLIYYLVTVVGPSLDSTQLWLDENASFLSWLGSFLWILFGVLALGVSSYTFVMVSALVCCPFNPILSEAAERAHTGSTPPSSPWGKVICGLPVTLFQETKKLLYYVAWSIPVLILCLIFMPAAPFIWGAFSSWMLALEFADYPMDNNGIKFHEMRKRLAKRRLTSFGFGLSVFGFAMIPVLNILTAPAAVCGATLLWLDELRQVENLKR
ncbi:MAG: CysZ protein [Planctomycetota bacterium]|jgi:CysZ protein